MANENLSKAEIKKRLKARGKELVGLEVVENKIKSLTGYAKNDIAQNGFGQKVEVYDVSKGEIAFMWIDAGKAEVMQEDEFDAIFTKVKSATN